MQPIFITGIGTDVGKTIVSAIVAEALGAGYWKPVQAGYADGTDSERVRNLTSGDNVTIYPETYKLRMPASPHIAAREEGIRIHLDGIVDAFRKISREAVHNTLVIEGAGGVLVPLNDDELVIDLIKKLDAKLVIVSRNYLGSINHSLLTAKICRQYGLVPSGWIFNDQYLDYEQEIADWSGIPRIASVPFLENPGRKDILAQAKIIRPLLEKTLHINT